MGTPDFALESFKAIAENPKFNVVACYSRPPKPAGRAMDEQLSPVHAYAITRKIPVFTPEDFNDEETLAQMRQLKADVAVVAAYGIILPEEVLDIPKHGCLNIHASLLPRWRGASPIQRAIQYGDKETGVTIMQMDKGMDTGDVIYGRTIPIDEKETAKTLHDKLAKLGSEMIVKVLKNLDMYDSLTRTPQEEEGITYAPKLEKKEGVIDWSEDAEVLERKIRAFNPWPACSFNMPDGSKVKIYMADVLPDTPSTSSAAPGTIIESKDRFVIKCGKASLSIKTQQKEGKDIVDVADFLNGNRPAEMSIAS